MPYPFGFSPKGSNILYSFRRFIPLIIIAAVAIALSLLSYQYSILTSEKIATAATRDIKDNARVQAYDVSKALENRLKSVRDNLEILANTPLIQLGEYSQARILINTAENTTKGFTDSYFWVDEMGKLQWAGSFDNNKYTTNTMARIEPIDRILLNPEILTFHILVHFEIQLTEFLGFMLLIQ